MQYSAHAKKRMLSRNVSESEVESIIANPSRGTYSPPAKHTIENYGFANDGRAILVVTDTFKDYVISVIEC